MSDAVIPLEAAAVPYTALVQQFRGAPAGKLFCLHGSSAVFRLSLFAAAHVLLNGVPVAVVDGTNRFDVYYLAEFARKFTVAQSRNGVETAVTPEFLLRNIFVSRAFTCYQMDAAVTERLPGFLRRHGSPVALIFGLLDTFYDDQAPLHDVTAAVQRVINALRAMRENNISVLLASRDTLPASPERHALFPRVAAVMDRIYAVNDVEGKPRIVAETAGQISCGAVQHRTQWKRRA